MAGKITLYRSNGACSIAAHMILREYGIPHETRLMTMSPKGAVAADGSMSAEEYRKIHHSGYVPALDVGGTVITENPAILSYIASQVPEKKLLGTNDVEKAQVVQWMAWLSGSLHGMGFGMLFRPVRFVADENLYELIKGRGREVIERCFGMINDRLEGRSFMVGEAETTADYYVAVFWVWSLEQGWEMETRFPNYAKLVRYMHQKKAVRETYEIEDRASYLS